MFGDSSAAVIYLLLAIAFAVLLFIIFRAFVLWYWKIDRIVLLLEELVQLNGGSLKGLDTTEHKNETEKRAFYKRHENEVNDPLFWIHLEEKTEKDKGPKWRGSKDWEKFQDYRRGYISDEQYQAAKQAYHQPSSSQ